VWYGIDNAPIEIKVMMGKDKHAWYTPGVVTKTRYEDATYSGSFSLYDDPKYSDHNAYLTAYLTIPGQRRPLYVSGTSGTRDHTITRNRQG
jgi:hypothetical protein